MATTNRLLASALLALAAFPAGCGDNLSGQIGDGVERPNAELEQPFTSDVATLVDFAFDGELTSTSGTNIRGQVRAQLMYTVGHLNGEPGVARLDKLVVSNTSVLYIGGGLYRLRYHAWLPVAWGHKSNLPSSYVLTLPHRVDYSGQSTFTTKYASTCNDGEGADVSVSNFWYHYRPHAIGCNPAPADVTTMAATVTVDNTNSYLKYPEYQKIWEDGTLSVVAVFGKYAAGARSLDDAGISAYNEFVDLVRAEYPDATTVPAYVPDSAGPDVTDITFTVQRGGGTITINVFLVEAVTAVSTAWKTRYAQLTPGADLIIYNGHAGLGANVAALSKMGKFFPGKYQILMLNGCDTFAYYDNTLPSIRAVLNPDDPTGTKYMDFITNSMPAYFASMAGDAMALIRAAANDSQPTSYQDIFHNMDRAQVVVVTGEEDNIFTPGYDPQVTWNGLEQTGAVGKYQTISYQTDVLQPGKYVFTTTPDPSASGGDADLRVRVGAPPTITSTYKCPSYVANSNERCLLNITTPSTVYIAVTGDATGVSSKFILRGWQLPAN